MLLDLQGLLACQPFANDVCPTKGDGQQRHQLLQPLRMGEMSLFQAKASTLQAGEERLDLPEPRVVRKRRLCLARCDHNHILTRRETQPADKQRQPPDNLGTLNNQWLLDTLRAKQPPDGNHLAAPVCNFRVFTHLDAEVHFSRAQPREPVTAYKLPVCTKISNRPITKDAPSRASVNNSSSA